MQVGRWIVDGRPRLGVRADDEQPWRDLQDAFQGTDIDLQDVFSRPDWLAALVGLDAPPANLPLLTIDSALPLSAPDPGGEIFCVGRNYAAHAAELGNDIPSAPMIFQKPRQCLIGPGSSIPRPPSSSRVDYEGELMLIVGRTVDGVVSDDKARRAIVAITLFNDISDRDAQNKAKESGKPWFLAKGQRGFGPIGPVLRIVSESEDLRDFRYSTRVNDEVRQQGDPSLWIWSPESLVRYLALHVGLRAGDMIATGTPAGVNNLASGDVVEVVAKGIGSLRNPVE